MYLSMMESMAPRDETIAGRFRYAGKSLAETRSNRVEMAGPASVASAPIGHMRAYAAGEIFASLRAYARKTGVGLAVTDGAGFRVDLIDRSSFSPDVGYWIGPLPWMECYPGAPVFAVEIRNRSDFGLVGEEESAAKRADYFAAGTMVVWEVDLTNPDAVARYTADYPSEPVVFSIGEIADAEPALPGWKMPVGDLFLGTPPRCIMHRRSVPAARQQSMVMNTSV